MDRQERSGEAGRMASSTWILIAVLGYLALILVILGVLRAATRRDEHEARMDTMKRHPSTWSRDGDSPQDDDEDEDDEDDDEDYEDEE